MRKAYLFRRPRRLAGYWRLTLTSFALGAAAVLLMPDSAKPIANSATSVAFGPADRDCADFASQTEAQASSRSAPRDDKRAPAR